MKQDKSSKGDVLFSDTLAASQVLDETYEAARTTLKLTMRVEYTASYASASDLAQLASLALNASLPSGFSPAPGGLTFMPIGSPSTDSVTVTRWSMRAERKLIQQVDEARVIRLVQGNSSRSADSRLQENLTLASPPEISLSPS